MKNMTQSQTLDKTINLELYLISREPALQSRAAMSPKKVADYQQAYNNGAEFPPLLVAKQIHNNGAASYRLLDGWHRVQALENNGASLTAKVKVRVIEVSIDTTLHELRFLGISENIKNGLGLATKDKRLMFVSYIKGRCNREGIRYKSYREIAKELNLIPHQTIARWMKSNFPAIARLMSKEYGGEEERQPHTEGTGFRLTPMPDLTSRERDIFSITLLEEAKASDNDVRGNIINWVKKLLEELELEAPYQDVTPYIDPDGETNF